MVRDVSTPTRQLFEDFFRQCLQLVSCEFNLIKSGFAQSAGSLASGVSALAAGAAIMVAGLIIMLAAVGLFLVRLGAAPDVAFLIVAAVSLLGGWMLIKMGGRAMQPSGLLPTRSLFQLSSLLGRR
jgi:Putative Actinobacterial Holin-X, holin superfamily III